MKCRNKKQTPFLIKEFNSSKAYAYDEHLNWNCLRHNQVTMPENNSRFISAKTYSQKAYFEMM